MRSRTVRREQARHGRRVLVALCLLVSGCSTLQSDPKTVTALRSSEDAAAAATDAATTEVTGSAAPTTSTTEPLSTTKPMPPGVYLDANVGRAGAAGTPADPFLYPSEALAALQAGDTLWFREGRYDDLATGAITGTLTGTADAPITLRPFEDEEVVIMGGGEWGDGIDLRASSFVIVEGFTIVGRDDSVNGSGVRAREGSHNIWVRNNDISNFGLTGVAGARTGRMYIEDNVIRHSGRRSPYQGSGISMWEAAGPGNEADEYANVIRGNLVIENFTEVPRPDGLITDGNCIIIDFFKTTNYEGRTLVENNTCINNGGRGVMVLESNHVTVRNNTLIENAWTPELHGAPGELVASGSTDVVFANNLILNSPEVSPIIVDRTASAIVIRNAVLNDVAIRPGNTLTALPPDTLLLLPTDPVLFSQSVADPMGTHRPPPSSPVVGAADASNQAQTDGCGKIRPVPGSIGAFEPATTPGC